MAGNNREPGRSVLSKALAILDAFAQGPQRLTLTDLVRHSGLPQATVHRLAGELQAWGALERDDKGRYAIGARLWRLGIAAPGRQGLRELALPYMQDLYAATHENVQLAVLEGDQALYVEHIKGHEAVPIVTEVGGGLPLHATGVGKVLLAYADPALVREVISHGLRSMTPYTVVMPGRLVRQLERIRAAGIAVTREEMLLGTVSVAAPIFGAGREVVAALSVVVRSGQAELRRLEPAVRTAAAGISREAARAGLRAPAEARAGRARAAR
ncbi:MAG: helix-turn-helix domain-containing protein [Streptosporangiales bacterium]|nr:helix-turn-helix domain-containing protein [Streptosporangiales bacterium]